MARIVLPLAFAAALLLSPCVLANPPESAHLDVTNFTGIPGTCYLNSLSQLVMYDNPSITAYDAAAYSGIGTTTGWGGYPGRKALCAHPRDYTEGVEVDLLRLCGADARICYGKGGACGRVFQRNTLGVTILGSEADAATMLKTLVAAGTPVQVHLDMYYLPGMTTHGSHFVVVSGYDASYVYVAEGGALGTDVQVPWESFLTGWRSTPKLSPIRAYWCGPYFMCYLVSNPVKPDDKWVTAWLGLDAMMPVGDLVVGPAAMREAARALRSGKTVESVVPGLAGGVLSQGRARIPLFFSDAGRPDIAALYGQSADLMQSMMENPSDPALADKLDQIANAEEDALTLMQAAAAGVEPLRAFVPAGGARLSSLDAVTFHWLSLPGVKNPAVQIAMKGDFSDRKSCKTFKPKNGSWFVNMGARDWIKVLPKDGGDRQLEWRVVGTQGGIRVESTPCLLIWDAQVIAADAPADSYSFPATERVRFAWHAPAITLRPRVAISATSDFSDKRRLVYLSPIRGASEASFRATTLARLKTIDDGDGIVYWRVEDASSRLTTVQPSAPRTLNLP